MTYCKICGAPAPEGKEHCWCCEHAPKLHRCEDADKDSGEDKKE